MTDLIYVHGRPVAGVSPRLEVGKRCPLSVCVKHGREYAVYLSLGGAMIAKAGNPHRAWELAAEVLRSGTFEAL